MGILETERSIMRIGMKEILAYRFSAIISLITGPIFFFVSYMVWKAVYAASGSAVLGGYTYEQIVVYYAISTVTFYLVWDNADIMIMDGVHSGSMIKYLTKPLTFIKYAFFDKIGHRFIALLIEFIPVILIIGTLFGFDIFIGNSMLFYAIVVALSFVIYFELNVIFGSLAFWFIKPRGLVWGYKMLAMLMSGFLIPLTFFPQWAQKIMFYLPFQYIRFAPAQAFSGEYTLAGVSYTPQTVVLMALINVIVLGIIMFVFWRISLKKFCGVGT